MIILPWEISGHFNVGLYRNDQLHTEISFDNIMTTGGLNLIGNGNTLETIYSHLQVGTGGTAPSAADTSLESPLGSRTSNNGGFTATSVFNTNPEYHNYRKSFFFGTSEVNGELRELGIFTGATGGTLANRSLFRDATGVIAPVNKTPEDVMLVRYDLRSYAPTGDVTGSIMVSGSSIDYLIRAASVGSSTGWLAGTRLLGNFGTSTNQRAYVHEPDTLVTRNSNPNSSPNSVVSSVIPRTYINNTFYRDVLYNFTVDAGNFTTGIGLFSVHPFANTTGMDRMFQVQFSPKIQKVTGQSLGITIRHTWRPRA